MMKHQPLLDPATVQAETTHSLHRDFETRSKADLKKVGAAVYAADPSTEITWLAYAVDDGPVQQWRPGDPVPAAWFEAAVNPSWTAVAHNDAFESAIELHILHPRYGFPLIPPDRHRCTQAMSLALGLPAKLGLLADVLEQANRKDSSGERLMHQMSKPRKARKDEDPAGVYWFEDDDRMQRLGAYNVQDVEVEREADDRLLSLSGRRAGGVGAFQPDQRARLPRRSEVRRGGTQDRQGRGPRDQRRDCRDHRGCRHQHRPDRTSSSNGCKSQGCAATKLDRKAIEKLLKDDELAAPARRVLELRARRRAGCRQENRRSAGPRRRRRSCPWCVPLSRRVYRALGR